MANTAMQTSQWYDNPDYSDLQIELSDGRKVHVHKVVLCTRNEYFKMACGVGSQFAERDVSVIELKEDNPDAVEHVLRQIYKDKTPIEQHPTQPWSHWLEVYAAADKYLEHGCRDQAYHHVRTIARALKKIDEIFDLFEALDTIMTDHDVFVALAAELQTTHLDSLLNHAPFRKHVEKDANAMWRIIDIFRAAKDNDTHKRDSVSPTAHKRLRRRRHPITGELMPLYADAPVRAADQARCAADWEEYFVAAITGG